MKGDFLLKKCLYICLIIIAVVLVLLLISAIIRQIICIIRCKKFKQECNSPGQVERVNNELDATGFAFDPAQEIFYSRHDAWQRKFGYRKLFDEMAPTFNMIIDSEPIKFEYDGRKWMLELWKGQYGVAAGAEIGLYVSEDGAHYESASDSEALLMSFVLIKGDDVVLRRCDRHWWLTGFRLGSFATPNELLMYAEITFPNNEMCLAVLNALRDLGYGRYDMSVNCNTIRIRFDRPYSLQPKAKYSLMARLRMKINKIKCKIFIKFTKRYPCMLDKIEYIKCRIPWLYKFIIKLFELL